MGKFFLSLAIGLVTGVICFFLSVAFMAIFLLIYGAAVHARQDMTLTYKVAAPVAIFAALCGFSITVVRLFRSAGRQKKLNDAQER